MYSLRPAARRLLSSSSISFLAKPRSISTVTPSALRVIRPVPRIAIQRRWNSDGVPKNPAAAPENQTEESADAEESRLIDAAIEAVAENPNSVGVVTERDEAAASGGSSAAEEVEPLDPDVPTGVSRYPGTQHIRGAPEPKQTVYVGNLFFDVTAEDLRRQMEKYGVVEHAKIIHDSRGLSKGFGYITYDTVEAATRAIEGMHTQIFEGRRVVVQYSSTNFRPNMGARPPSKTLYVGNLSFDMSDRELNDLFRDIRNVIDVRVAIDRKTGLPRGFAHADFIDIASAQVAHEQLSNKAPHGRRLRVDFSQTKAPRRSEQGQSSDSSPEQEY